MSWAGNRRARFLIYLLGVLTLGSCKKDEKDCPTDSVPPDGRNQFVGQYKVYDDVQKIERYYLINEGQDLAIGWVHNLNAYWSNGFYIDRQVQNYLGCNDPGTQQLELTEFSPNTHYYISYFPTRTNTTICPANHEVDTGAETTVTLVLNDPASAALNGTFPYHLDTLHSDYAFIISRSQLKSLRLITDVPVVQGEWDFTLYPNPTRTELFLGLPDEVPKDVYLYDLAGRTVGNWSNIAGPVVQLPIGLLAMGAYWVRVSDGTTTKTKKLIIH